MTVQSLRGRAPARRYQAGQLLKAIKPPARAAISGLINKGFGEVVQPRANRQRRQVGHGAFGRRDGYEGQVLRPGMSKAKRS